MVLLPLALVTAGKSVDLKRGPRRALFERGEAAFAEQFGDAGEKFRVFAGVEWQPRGLFYAS